MGKLSCVVGVLVSIASVWWIVGAGTRNPVFYLVSTAIGMLLTWLVAVFVWSWLQTMLMGIERYILYMLGIAHRNPEFHLPKWEEKPVIVHRKGPIRDHWWSERYYASVEYCMCKHKGCCAHRVVRVTRDI